ncbi:hypothetical protein [Microcoleus sp. FACHB-68]|uniref:hypothetical protein n=1 Tax=Microcoleus sp. FACHB-68 TaxID=2692826 RepID=UPI001687D7BE|nr:hypothetical protein [Microcoleus sp. FACHB-68]MBD1936009.1 hypothetical protein [Microcoleus sp. FACHB-68]
MGQGFANLKVGAWGMGHGGLGIFSSPLPLFHSSTLSLSHSPTLPLSHSGLRTQKLRTPLALAPQIPLIYNEVKPRTFLFGKEAILIVGGNSG